MDDRRSLSQVSKETTSMELRLSVTTLAPGGAPYNTIKEEYPQRRRKQYHNTKNYMDYIIATYEKNEFTTLVRNLSRDIKNITQTNFKDTANPNLKSRSRLGDLQRNDDSLTSEDAEKAELLNTYFTSVFMRENLDNILSMKSKLSNSSQIIVAFTPEIVHTKLNRLKITKSAGPDGYHPSILSKLAQSIKLPLSIIFTRSYEESCLPIAWKEAHVMHMKGNKVFTGNYRPVSLTSVI